VQSRTIKRRGSQRVIYRENREKAIALSELPTQSYKQAWRFNGTRWTGHKEAGMAVGVLQVIARDLKRKRYITMPRPITIASSVRSRPGRPFLGGRFNFLAFVKDEDVVVAGRTRYKKTCMISRALWGWAGRVTNCPGGPLDEGLGKDRIARAFITRMKVSANFSSGKTQIPQFRMILKHQARSERHQSALDLSTWQRL